MNYPKYQSELTARVFLCVSILFLAFGILSVSGFLQPSEHSQVQNTVLTGQIFCILGVIFCGFFVYFRMKNEKEEKLHENLIENANKTNGTVEKVVYKKRVKYRRSSPFIIYYKYVDDGQEFNCKSHYIWGRMDYAQGDTIVVFFDDLGNSIINI